MLKGSVCFYKFSLRFFWRDGYTLMSASGSDIYNSLCFFQSLPKICNPLRFFRSRFRTEGVKVKYDICILH